MVISNRLLRFVHRNATQNAAPNAAQREYCK